MGRNEQRIINMQRSESNVSFERTPFAIAHGYSPLVRALPTPNPVGIALPHTAGVPLNFIRWALQR